MLRYSFWWLLAGLTTGLGFLYVLGMWFCGMTPRELFKVDATPLMYDGKEPYEQWATKMEMARQAQAREESDGDAI